MPWSSFGSHPSEVVMSALLGVRHYSLVIRQFPCQSSPVVPIAPSQRYSFRPLPTMPILLIGVSIKSRNVGTTAPRGITASVGAARSSVF